MAEWNIRRMGWGGIRAVLIVICLITSLIPAVAYSQLANGDPDHKDETFRDHLVVVITSPVPDANGNPVNMWINESMGITAGVTDTLQYSKNGGPWYDYTEYGVTTAATWTIHWSVSCGTVLDPDSASTTFTAPDYSSSGQQTATLTATATETQRYVTEFTNQPVPAQPQAAQAVIKVNAFTISVDQGAGGMVGDAAHPVAWGKNAQGTYVAPMYGDGRLGWCFYNMTAGCTHDGGSTYIKATPNPNAPNIAPGWHQVKYGDKLFKVAGNNTWNHNDGYPLALANAKDDAGGQAGPNGNFTGTSAWDEPGMDVGANNDAGLPGLSAISWDAAQYEVWVEDGAGTPISNKKDWSVSFLLNTDNNNPPHWVVVNHTP